MSQDDNPFRSPQTVSTPDPLPTPVEQGDATGGIIPYKNVPALVGYYFGIASLIPCLGMPFGIAALVLGILGLKKRNRHPAVKGIIHAWIGIILGGISILGHSAIISLGFIAG